MNEHGHQIFRDILNAFARAPKGGTSVGGDRYEGGQFLPQDDFARTRKALDETLGAIRAGREVIVDCFDCEQPAVIEQVTTSGVLCRYRDRYGLERHICVEPRFIRLSSSACSADTSAGP